MSVTNEAKRPGRATRAETTQTERRRRKSGTTTDALAIPTAVKEAHPDMEFRWARDDGQRMQQLTVNDDWDKVPGVDPIHGGKGESGRGMKMHLLMKPKAFMDEDRKAKEARINQGIQERLAHPEAKVATESGAELYSVPGNRL